MTWPPASRLSRASGSGPPSSRRVSVTAAAPALRASCEDVEAVGGGDERAQGCDGQQHAEARRIACHPGDLLVLDAAAIVEDDAPTPREVLRRRLLRDRDVPEAQLAEQAPQERRRIEHDVPRRVERRVPAPAED